MCCGAYTSAQELFWLVVILNGACLILNGSNSEMILSYILDYIIMFAKQCCQFLVDPQTIVGFVIRTQAQLEMCYTTMDAKALCT